MEKPLSTPPSQGQKKKSAAPKRAGSEKVPPVAPPEAAPVPARAPSAKPPAEAAPPPVRVKKEPMAKKRGASSPPAEKAVPEAVAPSTKTKKASAKKAEPVPVVVAPDITPLPKATKVKGAKGDGGPVPPAKKVPPKVVKEAVEAPILQPKPRGVKKAVPRRKVDSRITVFVARGGPARGEADYEQAFANRHQALAFLSNQHGLSVEEQRQLAKASRLKLNRRWHGSEACALREIALEPDQAAKVLRGEGASA